MHAILANPPYIRESEWTGLQPEVSRYEPRMALVAGKRGTEVHERLLDEAVSYLMPGGWLAMEVGRRAEPGRLFENRNHASVPESGDCARRSRDRSDRDRPASEVEGVAVWTKSSSRAACPLHGEVQVSGAKNSALPILASTILGGGECVISNVPRVVDVVTMGRLLGILGAEVHHEGNRAVIKADVIRSTQAPYELVKTMRASVLVLGPLVARWGEAIVSLPGGCAIGSRPVNLHLAGLAKLGADVSIEHGYIRAKAKRLKGAPIYCDVPTVTGTENLMMAASLAQGTTVIENAAKEPEIVDLADFLVKRGAPDTRSRNRHHHHRGRPGAARKRS